jgi:hypothetical protein
MQKTIIDMYLDLDMEMNMDTEADTDMTWGTDTYIQRSLCQKSDAGIGLIRDLKLYQTPPYSV